ELLLLKDLALRGEVDVYLSGVGAGGGGPGTRRLPGLGEEVGELLVGHPELRRQAPPESPVKGEVEQLVALDERRDRYRVDRQELSVVESHGVARAGNAVDEAGLAEERAGAQRRQAEQAVGRVPLDAHGAALDQVGVLGGLPFLDHDG